MSPDELAKFEEDVIHGDDPGDADPDPLRPAVQPEDQSPKHTAEARDRLTKSGRTTLEDVEEAIKKSDSSA